MTSSQENSPPWSGSWHLQQDRDSQRDRLKDLEHMTLDLEQVQVEHTTRMDGIDAQLGWHKAALGLLAWVIMNGKLASLTPEAAALAASILKGLIK